MELLASQKSSFSFFPVKNGLIFSGIVRVLLGVLFIIRTSNPEILKAYLEPSQAYNLRLRHITDSQIPCVFETYLTYLRHTLNQTLFLGPSFASLRTKK